jgi:hypothetical protein
MAMQHNWISIQTSNLCNDLNPRGYLGMVAAMVVNVRLWVNYCNPAGVADGGDQVAVSILTMAALDGDVRNGLMITRFSQQRSAADKLAISAPVSGTTRWQSGGSGWVGK